ncbi:right-handed parallel beta-helix repeat-containing protein [Paenibacillus sp. 2TAB23]|uniref:right-handed parallel beta-helix repeat-containing protein n=1 Tax=Paenibacillus sp. 2TAB23 TaxID=3233004 RepID=UPI003F9C25F3
MLITILIRLILLNLTLSGLFIRDNQAPLLPAEQASYYVAPNGSDSNAGTIDSPWKTVQHAADLAEPGNTVYLRSGVYKQKLVISRSGSAGNGAITYSNYRSEKAVLDGAGLTVEGLEGIITLNDASYIQVKGLEIRNYKSRSGDAAPVGILVQGAGGYIQLKGNNIHSIQNTVVPTGKSLLGRDAHGIALYGTKAPESLHHMTISDNELHNLVLGSSESLVLNGNVEQFTISNNRIYDNDNIGIDIIGFEGIAPSSAFDQARDGRVQGNTIYNISSNYNPSYGTKLPNDSNAAGGIYIDGGKNIVVERNLSYRNDIGIELASEHKGKATSGITVRSNVIHSNRLTGVAIGGYDKQRGSTTDSRIVNNTIYDNDTSGTGSGQLFIQYDTSNNLIRNNIIAAATGNMMIYNEYKKNTGNVVDYNLYFTPDTGTQAAWVWKNKTYTGLADYQSGTGQDAHSLLADPKFSNPKSFDLHLKSGSPAIDRGFNDRELKHTHDFDEKPRVKGKTIDIGAFE